MPRSYLARAFDRPVKGEAATPQVRRGEEPSDCRERLPLSGAVLSLPASPAIEVKLNITHVPLAEKSRPRRGRHVGNEF